MDSPWMNTVADGLKKRGIHVVRFEFPYMALRRTMGKRPPDRMPVLLKHFEKIILEQKTHPQHIVIGGKSLGGRVASLICDKLKVGGLICLGYPFHALGKEPQDRINHLKILKTKTLIVQGHRDPFGTIDEVSHYPLSDSIECFWMEDGDHDFRPRKRSGHTLEKHFKRIFIELPLPKGRRFLLHRQLPRTLVFGLTSSPRASHPVVPTVGRFLFRQIQYITIFFKRQYFFSRRRAWSYILFLKGEVLRPLWIKLKTL